MESRAHRLGIAIFLASLCAMSSQAVLAQKRAKRVLVVDISHNTVPFAFRQRAITELIKALTKDTTNGRFVFVRQGKTQNALAQVKQLIERARQLSQQFQETEALQHLSEAETLFNGSYRDAIDIKPLLEVLVQRAKLNSELGNSSRARDALRKLAVLQPKLKLSTRTFPPNLVATFEHEKRSTSKDIGKLTIKSPVGGAHIAVDGKMRGESPVTVPLVYGTHYVAVGKPGASHGQLVAVSAPRQTISLTPPKPIPTTDNGLREAGLQRGSDWVLTIRVAADGSAYQLELRSLDARTVDIARRLKLTTPIQAGELEGYFQKRVARLKTLFPDDSVKVTRAATSSSPDADEPRSVSKKPWYKTWWFWTGVSVIAVGSAAATAGVLASQDPGIRLSLVR